MKKFFLLFLLCMGGVLFSHADNSSSSTPRELGGVVIVSKSTVPRLKHIPANADIVIIIEDECVTIRVRNDFGLGTYIFQDFSTGEIFSGELDSSMDSQISIPYSVTDFSSIEFSIEFEDGSWFHLLSNNG